MLERRTALSRPRAHGGGSVPRPGELELYDTQELIDELLRRTTFQGVVVHAEGGVRDRHWEGERTFRVHFNHNLGRGEAQRLLAVVSDGMPWAES